MQVAVEEDKKYTFHDYLTWPDEERWEIIDGVAYSMSPAPGIRHQRVTNKINILLSTHKNLPENCTVSIAPTDVVLSEHDIVQPDVFIVCEESKITDANIQGVPDITIEVIAPNTSLKDRGKKLHLYQKAGVGEYIIIDPIELYVERFFLNENGVFNHSEIFHSEEVLHLMTFENVDIPLRDVFNVRSHK